MRALPAISSFIICRSPFTPVRLCPALRGFWPLFLLSTFCFLLSAFASGWLCLAVRCWKLDVGCWMFGLYHKHPEYNSPPPPPSGWSGTTLVPLWYLPIPIDPPKRGVFNETSLFWLPVGSFIGLSRICGFGGRKRHSPAGFGLNHRYYQSIRLEILMHAPFPCKGDR